MPDSPGVYRMLDESGNALYVGKAKSLKKRVSSYAHIDRLPLRLQRMVMQTASMEITTTRTEAEALLLEANLIKSLRPKYNIELRDDKSFPYITIDKSHDFPRISKYRGKRRQDVDYFGPYVSAGDVTRAIAALQKAFLLRPCTDSVFAGRSRPCLEYQIKRCSAPCVGKISQDDYAELVGQARDFLTGKDSRVQERLTESMEQASSDMDYERAAIYRDRIKALQAIQAKQAVNARTVSDADVVAVTGNVRAACIQVFIIRGGKMLGNRAFFPARTEGYNEPEILEAFLGRFYQKNPPPPHIILSHDIYSRRVMEEALKEMAGRNVKIAVPKQGEKRGLVETALINAKEALERKMQAEAGEKELLVKVAGLFGVSKEIRRIEIYDNSHIFGKYAVGAMVVAGTEGFIKNAYRKFNVEAGDKKSGGDDFYMLRQVLTRRFGRLQRENTEREYWPDLVLIDGGAGHMGVAAEVFAELGIDDVTLVCIAKGEDRNAGNEEFHMTGRKPFRLEKNDPILFYLQRLRDEAHRFAITTHRSKRAKSISHSRLDDIPGIGAARKKALLKYFGSLRAVESASLEEITNTPGIPPKTAQTIHDYLH